MVKEEEYWDEHYFVVVSVDLVYIVQPNVGYIPQGPETKVFERELLYLLNLLLLPLGLYFHLPLKLSLSLLLHLSLMMM